MDYRKLCLSDSAETGVAVVMRHRGEPVLAPDGNPITVTVASRDSSRFKREVLRLARQHDDARAKGAEVDEFDALDGATVALLAACTIGWSWMPDPASFKGATRKDGSLDEAKIASLEFNRDNAEMIFRKFPDFREEVDKAIADRANFIER